MFVALFYSHLVLDLFQGDVSDIIVVNLLHPGSLFGESSVDPCQVFLWALGQGGVGLAGRENAQLGLDQLKQRGVDLDHRVVTAQGTIAHAEKLREKCKFIFR